MRVGDKIMQIKNNYQLEWVRAGAGGQGIEHGEGVFNGDMGELVALDDDELLATVRFDDERVALYEYNQLDELELAYAISVHKSQGSEFPAVILPLVATTCLLYTSTLLQPSATAFSYKMPRRMVAHNEQGFFSCRSSKMMGPIRVGMTV